MSQTTRASLAAAIPLLLAGITHPAEPIPAPELKPAPKPPRRGMRVKLTAPNLPPFLSREGWKLGRCDYCRKGSTAEDLLPVRKTPSKTLICPNCVVAKKAAELKARSS
jgi:hypothetical protein